MSSRDTQDTPIRAVLEARAAAIRQKNVEAALAPYARDIVRFDLAPPLARSGGEALDPHLLAAWFDTWRGSLRYELRDISITSAGDIGFAYGFVRIGGTKQDGQAQDVWARLTVCLRKSGDAWRIVHEHVSTPFYMDGSVKAAVDLAPPASAQ
jgi:PhnB protein